MTPKEYKQMMAYLTRSGIKDKVKFASDLARPNPKPIVKEMELFNAFNRRNPRADGGMLVQPSADGSRPGYADVKAPTKKQLEIAEKVHGNKYDKTGIDLWESLKQSERSNIRQGKTTGETAGLGKLKKNQIGKNDFINLVNQNKDKTYNEFVEILKDYRTKDNKPFTKNIIADRLRDYGLSGSFQKKPALGRSEASKERNREYTRKRYREMIKTEEGRAKIKEQKQKQKAKEYLIEGVDPQAKTAEQAIWRDAVATAKKNKDGKGRFSFDSGYKKSMKGKDFYAGKIKIKDNQTGKTFSFNTFKNYINKNAESFGIKNYEDAIKPYRQKFFINEIPNLRNNLNSALIPGWTGGDRRTAVTIQHDFGRQNNPLKASIAFYDANEQEYKVKDTFERSWAQNVGKDGKIKVTPEIKEAYKTYKSKIDKLNIISKPSMVVRDRTFGNILDLNEILKISKEKGAKIPRGTFKKAAEFENLLLKLSAQIDSDCASAIKQASKDGGRIGLKTVGSPDFCITKARNYMSEELTKGIGTQQNAKTSLIKRIIAGSANFLKQNLSPKELLKMENLIGKPALYGAAAFETGIVADDVFRKGMPLNVAAAESLFGSILNLDADAARAKNLLESNVQLSPAAKEYAQNIIDYDRYRKNELSFPSSLVAKSMPGSDRYFKMQEDLRNKIENTPETGAMDYMSALNESEGIFKAKPKTINVLGKDITIDAPDAPDVTPLTNKFAQPQGTRVGPMTAKQDMKIDLSLPTYDRSFTASDDFLNQYLKSIGQEPLAPGEGTLFRMREPDQMGLYGTQEKFAGGGIAKLAGIDEGPQRTSMNPDSQGLKGLFKRAMKG